MQTGGSSGPQGRTESRECSSPGPRHSLGAALGSKGLFFSWVPWEHVSEMLREVKRKA